MNQIESETLDTISYAPNRLKQVAYAFWRAKNIKKMMREGVYVGEEGPYKNEILIKPTDLEKKEAYNRVPVSWCAHCKSLSIINCETDLNRDIKAYCGDCYNTLIVEGSIKEWLINK